MSEYRRYRRAPRQTTGELTTKLVLLAAIATLLIGGLIATQMASGSDPALGPKAVAASKKSTGSPTSSSTGSAGSSGSSDPYGNSYGYSTSPYGDSSSGYGDSYSGTSGSSGNATQQTAPPVTSSTS